MEKDEKPNHEIAQTYAQDMAKVIEGGREGGIIKKIIHGEEEHEKEKRNLSPQSKKNKLFMLVGLLFIVMGFATLFFFFVKKKVPTVPVEQQFVPLIFNDKSDFVEVAGLTKDKMAQTVLNVVNATSVKEGGVEGIYLTSDKKVVGLRKFIELLKTDFIQAGKSVDLIKDNFLMGVVNTGTKDFFILLKARSTSDIFGSMRAWENKMFFDLHGFFGADITAETNYLVTAGFQDGVVENKNARILYDKDKKIVVMYIFADDTSVIITNTEIAAHELMLRLASSQIKK